MNETTQSNFEEAAVEAHNWSPSAQMYSFAFGLASALFLRALLSPALSQRSATTRISRHTQTPASEEDFFEEEDDEDDVVIESQYRRLGVAEALRSVRASLVSPRPPPKPVVAEPIVDDLVPDRPKLPPMEEIETFVLAGPPSRIFERFWEGPDFYHSVLANDNPILYDWIDESPFRTRRVECAHPLAVKVPRWTGIGDLSIPTVKSQRASWNNFVHERSQFSGFPLAACFAVESGWLLEETDKAGSKATRLTYSYRCTFDDSVPRWIRRLIVTNTRDELKHLVRKYRAEARKHFQDLSASPGLDDQVEDESDVLEFPVNHVEKRDLSMMVGAETPKLHDDIIRNECSIA